MASKGPPSEAVVKERIITHMNADHIDSVQRYVENYHKVSRLVSRNARMTDISLSEMTIAAGSSTYKIPFDPPMKALSEARTRVVKMDKDCIAAMGRSPYTVKRYTPPKGFQIIVVASICFIFVMLLREQHVLPGSIAYEYFLKWIPYFPYLARNFRLEILTFMVSMHVTETYVMSGRMRRHSVRLFSSVWWSYMISCFIEGYGTFHRLGVVVEDIKIAKEKAKH